MEILDRVLRVVQYAAAVAGCISLFQIIIAYYLRWQMARWMSAEFPRLTAGDVLTEEEQLLWNDCYEQKRQGKFYRYCELVFILLAMPAIAIYGNPKSESYDFSYFVCAMVWFVGFLIIFGRIELS